MKVNLFDFQQDALNNLYAKVNGAKAIAEIDNPHAISFSAPTGAGKTIVMTAFFESVFFGSENFDAQKDAVILWISDIPELNEQTRLKIEGKSDKIRSRQLINIDSTYDSEFLEPGKIYFINTQKLGTDKLLTKHSDQRQFTIWETITNTAKKLPDRFYVVIDEAHRGMKSGQGANKAQTIMQKFLIGSPEDRLCVMPIVIGISATPRRFNDLLAGTQHTVHKVMVPAEDVRRSGLLKDRVLIHYPDGSENATLTLLETAAQKWQMLLGQWAQYCQNENEEKVWPILVVQVEDGNDKTLSKTDISAALSIIENGIGRKLRAGEVAHTFHEYGDLESNGIKIKNIEASRIEENDEIGVVLFKMSLSTGWDCPRAEVMMSFRKADDHTYIAQLLGRMVRTPLARRVESDSELNDVHLYLPKYNRETVNIVIADLQNEEEIPPSETGSSKELITLFRDKKQNGLYEASQKLVTYRINAVRKQSSLKRLIGLARAITFDNIDSECLNTVKDSIITKMNQELEIYKNTDVYKEKIKKYDEISIQTTTYDNVATTSESGDDYKVGASEADVELLFNKAGRLLGNGLNVEFWKRNLNEGQDNHYQLKANLVLLVDNQPTLAALEEFANVEFDNLFKKNKLSITKLSEKRRGEYDKLRLQTNEPSPIEWRLPQSIDFRIGTTATKYPKHIYLDQQREFRSNLNSWEHEVVEEELKDELVVGWLRNLERKQWSLEIPYQLAGQYKPMFPDLVVIRKLGEDFLFDILEPHDPSRNDNFPKAIGLARFAEQYWHLFGRIQLIRKLRKTGDNRDHIYRLDMSDEKIRKKVLAINSNDRLNEIFEDFAKTR